MSPVSRGRKGPQKVKKSRRTSPFELAAECDCPACSAVDPQQIIDEFLAAAAPLAASKDPLAAEMVGASIVAMGSLVAGLTTPDESRESLVSGFIRELEAQATTATLAVLLGVRSVGGDEAGPAAAGAAQRLVGAGVRPPAWAAELDEPVSVAGCQRLIDSEATASVLTCVFHRAGRAHAVLVSVDHDNCGAADQVLVLDPERLADVLDTTRGIGRHNGAKITTELLDPAEFRWQVERALDARAVHDRDGWDDDIGPDDEDDGPPFAALATLMAARTAALPPPTRPPASHEDEDEDEDGYGHDEDGYRHDEDEDGLGVLQALARLAENAGPGSGRKGNAARKPPAKGTRSAGPARLYQIKVVLRYAQPPIWRRLEVPADISLARLHDVIQIAFGWDDSHLHVFETPYGNFGRANAELGHRAEGPVTLAQVASRTGSKLRYVYDFGDDWQHDIVVEKVLAPDPAATYPRCTGGRRAAPPDDCGGVWGYADLIEVVADHGHPDHQDTVRWLGLDDAAAFAPDEFDADAVNRRLPVLR